MLIRASILALGVLLPMAAWAQQPMLPPRPQSPADKVSERIGQKYWALTVENEGLRAQVEDLRGQIEAMQKREAPKPEEKP